jgi:PilZ domain-containing protein
MIDNVPTGPLADQAAAEATIDRRRHDRIAGPFDGVRVGALETALSIFDLSLGGCFVNATHEQAPGVRFVMKIALPYVGLITLKVETLSQRSEFGFAVRFVDLNEETASRLDQALQQLRERALQDE